MCMYITCIYIILYIYIYIYYIYIYIYILYTLYTFAFAYYIHYIHLHSYIFDIFDGKTLRDETSCFLAQGIQFSTFRLHS